MLRVSARLTPDGGLRFEGRWGRLIAPDPDLTGEARALFERDAGKGIHGRTAAALDGGPIQFDCALSVIADACEYVNSRDGPEPAAWRPRPNVQATRGRSMPDYGHG
jgi:hypothetical protein